MQAQRACLESDLSCVFDLRLGRLRMAYVQVLKQLGSHRNIGKYLRRQISTAQYARMGH